MICFFVTALHDRAVAVTGSHMSKWLEDGRSHSRGVFAGFSARGYSICSSWHRHFTDQVEAETTGCTCKGVLLAGETRLHFIVQAEGVIPREHDGNSLFQLLMAHSNVLLILLHFVGTAAYDPGMT